MMEVAKFEQGVPVVVTGKRSDEFKSMGLGYIVKVYSPSQARKFNADYSVTFKECKEFFDLKESELEAA